MEDRYEVKGKIGQGGLGTVYKAFDVRMNREVAIKRIISSKDDDTLSDEATRQLLKEASSLASLQHPNIVTIYDVGTDEDGPFVVMELLTGDTLEGIIGNGSFTWQDFRQLAPQILEALIAAQELHIVHRDLKPSNIMLTWLPSGKFQVKIVDFGLAKLSSKPSLQTIDQSDGVFGSIYFMAPEQFERVPLDHRVDLYAIGCVFYYALTGTYPFDGDTAVEVMASHLQHHITPLQDVRDGIPLWACDWIMWHINRLPSDRPEDARQALKYFVENDAVPDPELSSGSPAPVIEQPKRPKLIVPGSVPVPEVLPDPSLTQRVKTASLPRALAPPHGSKPSVHSGQVLENSRQSPKTDSQPKPETSQTKPAEPEPTPATKTVEEPASPIPPVPATEPFLRIKPASSQEPEPSQETAPAPFATAAPTTTPLTSQAPTSQARPAPVLTRAKLGTNAPVSKSLTAVVKPSMATTQPLSPAVEAPENPVPEPENTVPTPVKPPKAGMSAGVKVVIAVVAAIVAIILAAILVVKRGNNSEAALYNEMITYAAKGDATELPVDAEKLDILLRNAVSVASNKDRYVVYKALFLAKSTDGTDVDGTIADFATTREMLPDIRIVLIRDVLRKRKNPEVIAKLLDYARSTDDPQAAVAAIEAVRFMATEKHFQTFIDIIQSTQDDSVRKAAEENATKIIAESSSKDSLGNVIATTYDNAFNDAVRHSMLRLIGGIGGEKALALTKKNLDSPDQGNKISAIVALGKWKDQSGYKVLIDYIDSDPEPDYRKRAFETAFGYASDATDNLEENWTLLAQQARTQDEELKVIRGLALSKPEPWSFALLEGISANSENDKAQDSAERAMAHLREVEKNQSSSPGEAEEE